MKQRYLDVLNELLSRYDMSDEERNDILNDYNDMYDNWTERGMTPEEVEQKLGKPKSIIGSLVEGYRRLPKPKDKRTRFIALTPFISLVAFLVLILGFQEYIYSWMTFLLIPMSAIILEMSRNENDRAHITTALSPFITSIAYYVLGMAYGLWHPGWLVFVIIPVLGIFNSRSTMNFRTLLTALSPFAALIAFIVWGDQGHYDISWLVFFVIPFIGATLEKTLWKKVFLLIGIPVGVVLYYYFATTYNEPYYSAFAFSHLVIFWLLNGNIILWNKDAPKEYKIAIVGSVVAYVIISLVTGWWAITWLLFLAIPVTAILKETKQPETSIALMPFIALTIFMLVGFFLNAWVWGAFAFLLIPVVAIIKSV